MKASGRIWIGARVTVPVHVVPWLDEWGDGRRAGAGGGADPRGHIRGQVLSLALECPISLRRGGGDARLRL